MKKMKAASLLGIIIFVGIPLPTTGTWTASAIASILRMRVLEALTGVFIGNCISGVIILFLSHVIFLIIIKNSSLEKLEKDFLY